MMIQVESLTYSYPNTDEPALKEVQFAVAPGEFCGIVGANEAGKSTLCLALTGFVPHFYRGELNGKVTVAGMDVGATPLASLTGEVGLVFQNPFNQITGTRYTVREEIAYGLENLGVPRGEMLQRVEDVLGLVGLFDLAERSPFTLSGGQQQRLAIASVIVMQPKVLVLDEPTAQLDPTGTREVFTTLRSLVERGGTTVVLVEHKIEWLATFADRVLALDEGRLVADGDPGSVLTAPQLEDLGISLTRYTQAARLARDRKLVSKRAHLPITLSQALEYFHEAVD